MPSPEGFASFRVQIPHPNRNWLSVEAAETKKAVAELDRAAPSSTNLKILIFGTITVNPRRMTLWC
jgi:hypothetical protein